MRWTRRHNFSTGDRRRAFTLVEVLATLVLLGIVLPVAMRGVSMALFAASAARHTAEAAALAETKLNELIATGDWSMSGNTSGDFAPDHPDYRWTCQAVYRDYGLTELAVQVAWGDRGQERAVTVTTFVSDPSFTMGGF